MCGRTITDSPKEVTSMNKFLLAGEIVGIGDTSVTIRTVDVTPGGEYPVEHEVHFTDEQPVLSNGSRVQILGEIARNPEDLRGLRLEATADRVKDYEGKKDYNIARVNGKLHRGFEYLPPNDGKRGFGNFLMVVDEDFYLRGAVLTSAAAMAIDRSKKYTTGTIIHMEGRLQTRAFQTAGPDGLPEDREALEIVVRPEKLEILKAAEADDPFADFEKELAEAI